MCASTDNRPAAGPQPQFVTPDELASILRVHPRSLSRWAARKLIPEPVVLGSHLKRWDLQAVLQALRQR